MDSANVSVLGLLVVLCDTGASLCAIPFLILFPVLASLVSSYVDSIRNGVVPCIENAVTSMAATENSRVIEEAIQIYRARMERVVMPTPDDATLSDAQGLAMDEAINHFAERAIFDSDQKFQNKLNVSFCLFWSA